MTDFALVPPCPTCGGTRLAHDGPYPEHRPEQTEEEHWRLILVWLNSERPCPECAAAHLAPRGMLKCIHCGREVEEAEVIEHRILRLDSRAISSRARLFTNGEEVPSLLGAVRDPVICSECAHRVETA